MDREDSAAPRIVVDPNVYIAAAISGRGAPARLLEGAIAGEFLLVVSPLLLAEVREVLERDKFRRWCRFRLNTDPLVPVEF